jgi:hypothetical protein
MKPKAPAPIEDADFDPEELDEAIAEPSTNLVEPEVDAKTEALVDWDNPTASAGSIAPKVSPDDEATVPERLTQDGVEEAERDRRIAAADPDFEP